MLSSESHSIEVRSHLLWIDGVGVFQLVLSDEVTIGRADPVGKNTATTGIGADIGFFGNLSRRHLVIQRQQDDYIATAVAKTTSRGQLIEQSMLLGRRHEFELNDSVRLKFEVPSPLSNSARLEVLSQHRGPISLNGVVLMSETCLIGASPTQHVRCSEMVQDVVIARREGRLVLRGGDDLLIDGHGGSGWREWRHGQIVTATGLRMRLESSSP